MPDIANIPLEDQPDLEVAASHLAESTLKRALAQLICEAIDKETKEEAVPEDSDLDRTARCLVGEVMREAWRVFLDDCDLKEWLEEEPEGCLSRKMAQDLLKKAKADAPEKGKTTQAAVDLDFFQAPREHSTSDPLFPRAEQAAAAPSRAAPNTVAASEAKDGASAAQSAAEELPFQFDGADCRIDLRAVRPFLPALSKATSIDREGNEVAILLFDSAQLPTRSSPDYDHVMHHIFLLTMYWVEEYMYTNYSIVYLHGNASKDHWPRAKWLKQWCHALNNKTSKHLSHLFVLFPTLWIRTLRIISRPFVKIKASIHFVSSVRTLLHQVPEVEGIVPKALLESNATS